MKPGLVAGILLGLLGGSGSPGTAATLRVPSSFPTIQAGLDASVAGDTVLVAPGTYTDFEVRYVPGGGWRTACVYLVDGVVLRSEQGACVFR